MGVAGGGVADYGDGADGHVGVDVGQLVALEAAAEAHFCWWVGEGEGGGGGGMWRCQCGSNEVDGGGEDTSRGRLEESEVPGAEGRLRCQLR